MIPQSPPGRKPRYQGIAVSPTKVIDAVDKRCIRIGYSLFVGDKTSTITNAYVEMLRRFYTAKDLSKNPESGGRLRVETQNGFECGALSNATKANQTERFGSGLESIVVALCARK